MDAEINLAKIILIVVLLAPLKSTQSVLKSIHPMLDPQRCSLLFSFILQRKEFSELPVTEIRPMFLNALKVPASKVDLEKQLKIISNETIFVEIGPSYFYGPSFFPPMWRTNIVGVNRTRLVGFGLSSGVQNGVIGAAFEHLTSQLGIAKLAYIFDNMEGEVYPFADIGTFLKEEVGQFHIYHLCDFTSVEDALGQILVDGANVLVLNVAHQAALELLHKGVTLSGKDFHVHDTNFFAVEFSTNGKFTDFTELSVMPKPITPKDLIFRDMAVVGLQKLAELLRKDLKGSVPLITSTVDGVDEEALQQTWNFYSYMDVTFDTASLYKVQISTNGPISGTFQALNPPPERRLLLQRLRRKPLRLGTVVNCCSEEYHWCAIEAGLLKTAPLMALFCHINGGKSVCATLKSRNGLMCIKVPPIITEETSENGVKILRGAEIALARELLKRLNVSYNIAVYNTDLGERRSGRWTGIFGHLEQWNIDLLVGPFTKTWDRMISFRSTTPIRSIGYSFMYFRPSLSVPTQIFQFVVTFEASTWLLIFLTTIGVGVTLALVHKISPSSLSYSIHPAIIFVFGYLFQVKVTLLSMLEVYGVRTRPPRQTSSQILIVVWWFFCLILIIAFCTNYASYRSFTALETLPTTVATLLHQEYYKYAYINGSSMELQMRVPLDPSIYSLYTVINKKFKKMIPPNRSAGVDQTIKGGFALLDESPFIEYYARKYCLETSLTLWHGAYVFYMPKLLPYYTIINEELTMMIADGTVDRIYNRAQEELLASLPRYCGATINDQAIEAMRIPLVQWSEYSIEFAAALGIFVISLIGLFIVLIVMTVEFLVVKGSFCDDALILVELQVIKNEDVFVEIGPDYFYGPSFFPLEWKTNSNNRNRSRIVGFDFTFDVQNQVLQAVYDRLTSDIGVVKLAYLFDYTAIEAFQFLKKKVGQFLLYQLRDFNNVEDALSQILIDNANVLVLNVDQQAALKLLAKAQEKNILQQPFYWIVFNAVPPVVTEETTADGTMVVNGPEIALAKALLKRLNVSYNITVFDLDIGKEVDGRWTGIFGLLEEWDIDLLVGPFSDTWDRSKSFLGTTPIRSITYNYMYRRPSLKASLQIFQFVVAFDGYTWLLIILTAAIFGAALTLLHKISPNTLSYSIHPSMLFVFGYLFQGVRTRPPRQTSSQILIVVWWFFCLILIIAFCTNYASYRSFTALETLPTTVATLLHQEYYKYGYINGSNTDTQMSASLDPSIYALYTEINTKYKDMIPPNRSAGVDQTIKGGFALLDESPFIEYYARKYCLETSLTLWHGAYVFYMPKLLPYYTIINEELTMMIADGTVDRIYNRGYEEQLATLPVYCGATFKDKAIEAMRNPLVNWSDYSVEFASAFGIFIVSLIGLVIVLIVFVVEFCLGVYKSRIKYSYSQKVMLS
ncbi:unnamed protein product [Hydatigera taeniaeformis]|uniref:Glutamate receptor n=1 Tax=Hydatigena taeniaeformis TaxID=6205 RepID=A0A158REC2_HYDTA|nr:unnamed protein product [Hydatigera taeniaeformis]